MALDQISGQMINQGYLSCIRMSGVPTPQFGTTNTMIRRFLTTELSQGTDVTYADTSAAGASFTINNAGIYAISYSDNGNAATTIGISKDSAALTTPVGSIPVATVLAICSTSGAAYQASASWTGYLPAGAVIRAHAGGTPASTQTVVFTITRVA